MKTQKAFTLIELLIVIAIIGILAGVILVSVSGARDKAKANRAYSTMESISKKISSCLILGDIVWRPPNPAEGTWNICQNTDLNVKYPDIADTGFVYVPDVPFSGSNYAVAAYTTDWNKFIVCASNFNAETYGGSGWFSGSHPGVSFDFTGTSGCRKYGF